MMTANTTFNIDDDSKKGLQQELQGESNENETMGRSPWEKLPHLVEQRSLLAATESDAQDQRKVEPPDIVINSGRGPDRQQDNRFMHHGRKHSANEIEITRLRLQNQQKQLEGFPEGQTLSHTTKKQLATHRFELNPQPFQKQSEDPDKAAFDVKESSSFRDQDKSKYQKSIQQKPMNIGVTMSQQQLLTNKRNEILSPPKVSQETSVDLRRAQNPSTSQPPASTYQPVMTSRDQLNLASVNMWRSPVRTTSQGNIGLLTSNIKFNRQLFSGSKHRGYRDHHRELLQERSDRLEDELKLTQTTLRQKEGSLKIKIALLEQQVAQLKSQISDAEDRQEGLKNRYDNILLIIQQQLKEANLSEASFNAIILNLNHVQHLMIDSSKYNTSSRKGSQALNMDLSKDSQTIEKINELKEEDLHTGSQVEEPRTCQNCQTTIADLNQQLSQEKSNNEELATQKQTLEERIRQIEEESKKISEMFKEQQEMIERQKQEINNQSMQTSPEKVKEEVESDKKVPSPIQIKLKMDRACQVDTVSDDLKEKLLLAEKLLKEKELENKTLHDQVSFIWRQIEKLEKLQQGSLNVARSRSQRRNLALVSHDSEVASTTHQTDTQTNKYSNAPLTTRPPMNRYQNTKGAGRGKMIKQQLFGLKQQVELLMKDGNQTGQQANQTKSTDQLGVAKHGFGQKRLKIDLTAGDSGNNNQSNNRNNEKELNSGASIDGKPKRKSRMGQAKDQKAASSQVFAYKNNRANKTSTPPSLSKSPMKKAQSSSVIMKNTNGTFIANSQNESMNKPDDQVNCKTNTSRDVSCDTNEILTKNKNHRIPQPSVCNLDKDEDEVLLSERRRVMKPSLKCRSSSKVSSVKQELAKQLLALRSSGENLQLITFERKLKDEASAKGSEAHGKGSEVPNKGFEVPDISLKKSANSFNLQMVNKNIMNKNEEVQQLVDKNEHKQSGGQHQRQMSRNESLNNHKKRVTSPESCDWCPGPGAAGGSSIVHNRRKMDKYSFQQQNIGIQSVNHNGVKLGAAYGKMKSSRYETFSDNSRFNDSKNNDNLEEQAVYFGAEMSQQKKLITNLSQRGSHNNSRCHKDNTCSQDNSISQKNQDRKKQQNLCGFNCEIPRAPAQIGQVNDLTITNVALSQNFSSSAYYQTQPKDDKQSRDSMTNRKFDKDPTSATVPPLRKMQPLNSKIAEIRRQYDSLRPEVQITLSEEGSQNELGLTGKKSSQQSISPVKQEAPKAGIMDLAKGTPAMVARHIYDNMPFEHIESQFRSRSQCGARNGDSGCFETGGQAIKLLQPVRTTDLAKVELDLNTAYYEHNSSNSSNSSVCSELLQQEQFADDKTLHASDVSNSLQLHPPNVQRPYTSTSHQNKQQQQQQNSGQPQSPTAYLNQLDSLYCRLRSRDQKIGKLRQRNRTLKRRANEAKESNESLQQKLDDLLARNEFLELQLQKFECRLKQAQILINDSTDRVELQLNRGSEAKELEVEGAPRKVWDHPPLEFAKVQNSIESLNKKKSQIRQKERSRQRSPANQASTANINAEKSQNRKEDNPDVVILNTDRQYIRVPSQTKSPIYQHSEQVQKRENQHAHARGSSTNSFLSKRANSMNSTPNLYQFRKQFRSTTKLPQQPDSQPQEMKKQRAVPMIDLSGLNQLKQAEWTDLTKQCQEFSGAKQYVAQAVHGSAKYQNSTCLSQRRNFLLPQQPLPPQTPGSSILGKGHKILDQAHASTTIGDANYSSQNSNLQSKVRQYDNTSSEIRALKHQAQRMPHDSQRSYNKDGSSKPTSARVRGPKLETGKARGKYDGSNSRGGKNQKNGSRTCNMLGSDEWNHGSNTINSATVNTKNMHSNMKGQERTLMTADSVGVFKHLDLQDIKSVSSTQPSNKQSKQSTLGGPMVSNISIVTGTTGTGFPLAGTDSKSSFKFGGAKKQMQSTKGGGDGAVQNLVQKSSESALSQIPHRQRANLKKSTPMTSAQPTPSSDENSGPKTQRMTAMQSAGRVLFAHKNSQGVQSTEINLDVASSQTQNVRKSGQHQLHSKHSASQKAAFR